MVTYEAGNGDYLNYLTLTIAQAKRDYRSLAEVACYDHREVNRNDLLRQKFPTWTPVGFQVGVRTAVDESKPEDPRSVGGSMVVMADDQGDQRCVVILSCCSQP